MPKVKEQATSGHQKKSESEVIHATTARLCCLCNSAVLETDEAISLVRFRASPTCAFVKKKKRSA